MAPTWYPPAWYPDPTGVHEHRWWDGQRWTDHVSDAGRAGRDPLPDAGGGPPGPTGADGPPPAPGSVERDPFGGWPLPVALAALVASSSPVVGLAVGGLALAMAVTARRRRAASGLAARGTHTAALVVAALALVVGLASTAMAWLVASDETGFLAREQRAIEECLAEASVQECFRASQERLRDELGR